DEQPESFSTFRKRLLIAVLVLIVLRGIGVITLNYYNYQVDNQMNVVVDSETLIEERLNKTHSWDSVKRKTNGNWREAGFHFSAETPIFTDFQDLLDQELRKNSKLQFKVQKVELSGPYWFPLSKSGTVKYQLEFDCNLQGRPCVGNLEGNS